VDEITEASLAAICAASTGAEISVGGLPDRRKLRRARPGHPRAREGDRPNYIRFGLTLATEGKGDSYFNLLASYRATWVNRSG